ncbi:MAG TPA: paraquat-inducible protein A [Gammaproteobacteria bacterium]|nr:paraquat-inducible protein A [Gammaproteobacteria bacterium]
MTPISQFGRLSGIIVLLTALGMLAFNIDQPILHVEKFWIFEQSVSIWGGMMTLYQAGELVLGSIILLFSIVFPIGKILLLLAFLIAWPKLGPRGPGLINWLSVLGKWSMLDVLIVAILVVSVRLGMIVEAALMPALYWFIASVLLTNLVSTVLDWRLRTRLGASPRATPGWTNGS